ncbi:MAG: ferritin family protein [Pseudomonadota bacterium]
MMHENQKVIKIFEYALNQEQTGLNFFRSSLERMGIGAAVTAFKRLIDEEEKHVAFITRILGDLKEGRVINTDVSQNVDMEPTNYFDEREKSEFLRQCVEGSMIPDVTIFNTAWLIERDLSEYYGKMARLTEGQASHALTLLSNWEKEHEKFFREYRDRLSAVYAEMPWGG